MRDSKSKTLTLASEKNQLKVYEEFVKLSGSHLSQLIKEGNKVVFPQKLSKQALDILVHRFQKGSLRGITTDVAFELMDLSRCKEP